MSNFLPIYPVEQKYNSQNSKVESYNAVNIPYGWCFLPSNANYRQGAPGPDVFGDGVNYTDCIPDVIKPTEYYRPYNNASVNNMDSYFFKGQSNPMGSNKDLFNGDTIKGGPTDLQSVRPNEPYSNYYITLAANSLKLRPDLLLSLLFSDSNLNHIRDSVVQRVKEITADSGVAGTAEGVVIQPPNMDDLFYYMVNVYQTYKINNGSICFINLQNKTDPKAELLKLNSDILQDYVSKMISQINMYIYYYKDASQLPEQLSLPTYTAMKGSRTLEYNTGFVSGNSTGVASYNQVGNIL